MEHSEGFLKLVSDAKARIRETTPEEVSRRQQAGEHFVFVDVREDNEWNNGRAAGAIHLGKGIIERDIERAIPDHDAEIILYCGGGYRSALAAEALERMGYGNVVSMDGGWTRWKALGLPIDKD
jgi:rhodanese-related sulfurtransferase